MMSRRCARCGADMDVDHNGPASELVVSQGLCGECARHLAAQGGVPLVEYLDGLGVPVAVVDRDGVVKAANRQLCDLVRQDLSSVRGKRGGDVFECAYAGLPGGCGQTIHCSACAIRRAVTETMDSGISRERVPASLQQGDPGRPRQAELLISTQRVGSHVLLRIDMMDGRSLLD